MIIAVLSYTGGKSIPKDFRVQIPENVGGTRKDDMGSTAFLRFMAGKFPCP